MPDDNFCQKTRRGSGMKKLKKPLMIAVPLFLVLTAIAAFILFIGSCPAKTIFDNTENFGPLAGTDVLIIISISLLILF